MNAFVMRLSVVAAAGTMALLAALPARAQDAGDPVNGKRMFLADGCFLCHGRSGQGGAMNYPAPPLAGIELPVESFVAFLREAPNDMPAYAVGVLSDKDAADIHAYLRTLPGRKNPKDFPLLNQ